MEDGSTTIDTAADNADTGTMAVIKPATKIPLWRVMFVFGYTYNTS
jgi:hypothetical protein